MNSQPRWHSDSEHCRLAFAAQDRAHASTGLFAGSSARPHPHASASASATARPSTPTRPKADAKAGMARAVGTGPSTFRASRTPPLTRKVTSRARLIFPRTTRYGRVLSSSPRIRSFVTRGVAVIAVVGLGLDLTAGCARFGAAEDPAIDGGAEAASDAGNADAGNADADAGSGDASTILRGVPCGKTRCPHPQVCCFEADAGTETCTSAATCTGAPLECTTTLECVDAGNPPSTVCCAYNNATNRVLRTACVQGSACDARGPQDWLCDPTAAPGTECTEALRALCKSYNFYPVPAAGFAYCGGP